MATPANHPPLAGLRRAVVAAAGSDLTDAQLLGRYAHARDEAAFESLLRRHGPMVLGVCRRYLGDTPDAHDAFQATFLVLVRKASRVSPAEMLPNWLYGVARQTALRARTAIVKRRARERQFRDVPEPTVGSREPHDELRDRLDTELARLPDNYRVAIVLCDLEERTHHEAARLLGWPVGTVSSRLSRARQLLARRLVTKGGFSPADALAPVPATLVQSTLRLEPIGVAGQPLPGGTASATVFALAKGVLSAMAWKEVRKIAVTLLLGGLVLLGGGLLSRATTAPLPEEEKQATKPAAPAPVAKEKEHPKVAAEKHVPNGFRVESKENRVWVFAYLGGIAYRVEADHFKYDVETGVLFFEAAGKGTVKVVRSQKVVIDEIVGYKVKIVAKTGQITVEGARVIRNVEPKVGRIPALDFGFPLLATPHDARQVFSFYLGLFQ